MKGPFSEENVLKIGKIDFLNTLPFFRSPADCPPAGEVEFVPGTPAEINEKLKKGEIDAGIASSFLLAACPGEYAVLPGFCIAAQRKTGSVFLYSTCPLERLDGKTIALSAKSLSAATLLKILFRLRWNFSCDYVISPLRPDEMLSRYPACLVIGDEALFSRPQADWGYDVGGLWWEWTRLPFCFALWTVRKSFCEKFPSRIRDFSEWLNHNLERNLKRIDPLLDSYRFRNRDEKLLAGDYLAGLSYRMTGEVEKGLGLFFEYAREAGLIARVPELEFFREPFRAVGEKCSV
ncbi:MAG TPA: menaquinone biosynthesis protein [Candidatus Omnitrophota bacterium]|nr:menaquinone biosynthesis protein [Candidatus Omnitrophota bacterium]